MLDNHFGKVNQNFTKEQNNNLVKFLSSWYESLGNWEELLNSMENITTQESAHDLAVYLRSILNTGFRLGIHITLCLGTRYLYVLNASSIRLAL